MVVAGSLLLLLVILEELVQGDLLGAETQEEGGGGDGGHGSPGSVGEHQTPGGGEGGRGSGLEEERLRHGHADHADGESDSEKALRRIFVDCVNLERDGTHHNLHS